MLTSKNSNNKCDEEGRVQKKGKGYGLSLLLKGENMQNRTKEFKLVVIEQVYIDSGARSGFDIQNVPRERVDAMLDVIGGILFDGEWKMNKPIERDNG